MLGQVLNSGSELSAANSISLFVLLLVICSCARVGQEEAPLEMSISETGILPERLFPDSVWYRSSPEVLGINPTILDTALAYLGTHCKEDGLEETMIIRRGHLVWAGDSIDKVHDVWSCTKSFTSSVVGMLEAEGKLKLDDKVARYEPLLAEKYPEATFRDFVTMTSGYNATGRSRWGEDSEDWSLTPYEPGEPLFAPGTAYTYWDEAMIMLGRALTQVMGESLESYAGRKLLSPIGIPVRPWWGEGETKEEIPINFGGTGLKMSASEQARFGLLILNKGYWKGQEIVPAAWVEAATQNQVPVDLNLADTDRSSTDGRGIYGYNWWIINKDKDAPVAGAFTSGLNHNVCLVVPEWDMVIVRMGVDGNPARSKHEVYSEFLKRLAPGIK